MIDHTEVFCFLDDFCKKFEPIYQQSLKDQGLRKRNRSAELSLSEILLIAVWFHQSYISKFKYFIVFIKLYHKKEFPKLPTYERISALVNQNAPALMALFEATCRCAEEDNVFLMDSTTLPVCHNKRIRQHRTFKEDAARGKTSMGWFYGYKLHLVVNRACEIVSARITAGNVADVSMVEELTLSRGLKGKFFGDRGYISKKIQEFMQLNGCEIITRTRSNMADPVLSEEEEHYLRQRNSIETVNGQHKCDIGLQHTRHRSLNGLVAHVYGVMIAYQMRAKKVSIRTFQRNA